MHLAWVSHHSQVTKAYETVALMCVSLQLCILCVTYLPKRKPWQMPMSIFFGTNLQVIQQHCPQPRVDSSDHLQLLFSLVRPVDLQIHLYGERHPAPTPRFVMHLT